MDCNKFLKNMLKQCIFSNFLKKIFKNFRKFFENFLKTFLKILWKFFQKVFPPTPKKITATCMSGGLSPPDPLRSRPPLKCSPPTNRNPAGASAIINQLHSNRKVPHFPKSLKFFIMFPQPFESFLRKIVFVGKNVEI